MEKTQQPGRISGAFLILSFCSFAGIAAAMFFSGYLGIAIGMFVIVLALTTNPFESHRDKTIVYAASAASVIFGVEAIALGVLARALAQLA